jgi:hypothetical protein
VPNAERRTPNAERRTPNAERRDRGVGRRRRPGDEKEVKARGVPAAIE